MPYTSLLVRDTVLLCFPPEDAVFAEAARRAVEAGPVPEPGLVEAALRDRFPRILIRERDPLASFGTRAWYLYRDGRYSPFGSAGRWWDDPLAARIVLDDAGTYLDANQAALDLLRTDLATLRGARPGSFTIVVQRPDAAWTLPLLMDTGELHTTMALRRADGGADVPVEVHLTRDGDGPGRHVSVLRLVSEDGPDSA